MSIPGAKGQAALTRGTTAHACSHRNPGVSDRLEEKKQPAESWELAG